MSTIEKTKRYELFTLGEIQRKMHDRHIQALKKSMKKYGFLESKPITVYEDGVLLHIIDGHHRFSAAKELGIPVVYLVVKKSEKDSLMDQGKLMIKWSFADFCKAWADAGKGNYIDLMAYSSLIPIRIAANLLANNAANAGNVSGRIENGTFAIKSTAIIDRLLSLIADVGESNKVVTSRAFIASFAKCMQVKEFSADQLQRRIIANPMSLIKTANEAQMLDQLEEIYNFKSAKKIPLAHLVREAMAEKSPKAFSK